MYISSKIIIQENRRVLEMWQSQFLNYVWKTLLISFVSKMVYFVLVVFWLWNLLEEAEYYLEYRYFSA